MTIELTTREELINTLHLATELEHNLMRQYLFAAYTMKRSTSEGVDEVQLEKTRGWGALVTVVARQEMCHLNLLTSVGGRRRILFCAEHGIPRHPGTAIAPLNAAGHRKLGGYGIS